MMSHRRREVSPVSSIASVSRSCHDRGRNPFRGDCQMPTLLTGSIHPITLPEPEQSLARSSGESLTPLLSDNVEPVMLRFADPRSGEEVETKLPAAALRV